MQAARLRYATSLTLLQACYRNPDLPLTMRIRCAGMALPMEHPKLAVSAVIDETSFPERLERALRRVEELRRVEAKTIKGTSENVISDAKSSNGGSTPTDPPLPPPLPNPRVRRI